MANPKEPDSPGAEALAGLAREVEQLRRTVRTVAGLPGRVEQLAATLAQAVDDLAGGPKRPDPVRPSSWLAHATDPDQAARALGELTQWVGEVYLRYPVAARELSDCWLWHPDVIEELAWLHLAWQLAYGEHTGTVTAVGDWHDRYRPGVVARIRTATRVCALQEHTGSGRPTGTSTAPSIGSVPSLATWWASARDQQPPAPTPADLDEAMRRLQKGSRR